MAVLNDVFRLREAEDVRSYLDQHEDLLDVLYELFYEVNERFPPPTELALEIYEFGNHPLLYVIAMVSCGRRQADEIFAKLDEEFWMPQAHKFHDKLALDMEYR